MKIKCSDGVDSRWEISLGQCPFNTEKRKFGKLILVGWTQELAGGGGAVKGALAFPSPSLAPKAQSGFFFWNKKNI
jgi:hypothetical protein